MGGLNFKFQKGEKKLGLVRRVIRSLLRVWFIKRMENNVFILREVGLMVTVGPPTAGHVNMSSSIGMAGGSIPVRSNPLLLFVLYLLYIHTKQYDFAIQTTY